MAVPKKLMVAPNPATRDLWRFVESGEIDKFEAVLACAEINARNEHGMTALMHAARYGRVRMVRTLLDHGADPNVVRNDNFTALSLAAFFGHTEVVEVLLHHGARTDVATRYGTSPHMWAKARSFEEVVQCLEERGEETRDEQIEPVAPPVVAQPPAPAEVKTLKDPPEIWDLVHEAPRSFDPRSAFMTRIRSLRTGFFVRAAILSIVIGLGLFATLFWRNALPLHKADTHSQPVVSLPATTVSEAAPVAAAPETNSVETVTAPIAIQEAPANVVRRPRPHARSSSSSINTPSLNTIENAPAPAPPSSVAVKPESRNESGTKNKTAAPLSTQMISPPKTVQPKAKVIQWP